MLIIWKLQGWREKSTFDFCQNSDLNLGIVFEFLTLEGGKTVFAIKYWLKCALMEIYLIKLISKVNSSFLIIWLLFKSYRQLPLLLRKFSKWYLYLFSCIAGKVLWFYETCFFFPPPPLKSKLPSELSQRVTAWNKWAEMLVWKRVSVIIQQGQK